MSNIESDSSLLLNQEPQTKRAKRAVSKLPKYINRVDGKGFYCRLVFRAKSIEEASDIVCSLYKELVIDDSYLHAYTRENKSGTGTSLYVSVHGILHVVSRDYDFQFLRKRLPNASFKISTYPDKEYKRTIQKEIVQTGTIPNNGINFPYNSYCTTGSNFMQCNQIPNGIQ